MKIPSYLSVSSLNTWRRNPLFWVCKYSLGYRDVSGENAIRGIHVENAVNEWGDQRVCVKNGQRQ